MPCWVWPGVPHAKISKYDQRLDVRPHLGVTIRCDTIYILLAILFQISAPCGTVPYVQSGQIISEYEKGYY